MRCQSCDEAMDVDSNDELCSLCQSKSVEQSSIVPQQNFNLAEIKNTSLSRVLGGLGWLSELTPEDFETVRVDAQGTVVERIPGRCYVKRYELPGNVPLEMVRIRGGAFMMGSPEDELDRKDIEGPQHRVELPDFMIGKYPVTQAQYESVMGTKPSRFKGENRPVERVSWREAIECCQKLSEILGQQFRLPSESEWEYACRGGTTTPFSFGETLTSELANYDARYTYAAGPEGDPRGETVDVDQLKCNCYCLYGMHGNVWEWCQDNWHDNYEGAPWDGSTWVEGGDESLYVIRGGSWFNYPWLCRSASRYVDNVSVNVGFRVACSAPRTSLPSSL